MRARFRSAGSCRNAFENQTCILWAIEIDKRLSQDQLRLDLFPRNDQRLDQRRSRFCDGSYASLWQAEARDAPLRLDRDHQCRLSAGMPPLPVHILTARNPIVPVAGPPCRRPKQLLAFRCSRSSKPTDSRVSLVKERRHLRQLRATSLGQMLDSLISRAQNSRISGTSGTVRFVSASIRPGSWSAVSQTSRCRRSSPCSQIGARLEDSFEASGRGAPADPCHAMEDLVALVERVVFHRKSHDELIETVAILECRLAERFLVQLLDRRPENVLQVVVHLDLVGNNGAVNDRGEKLTGSPARLLAGEAGRELRHLDVAASQSRIAGTISCSCSVLIRTASGIPGRCRRRSLRLIQRIEPVRFEPRPAGALPAEVGREMIHGAHQPGPRVSSRLELHDGQNERILNHVPGIFLGKPVLPSRPPDQGKEQLPVEPLQLRRQPQLADVRPSGRPMAPPPPSPRLALSACPLATYCHEPQVAAEQRDSEDMDRHLRYTLLDHEGAKSRVVKDIRPVTSERPRQLGPQSRDSLQLLPWTDAARMCVWPLAQGLTYYLAWRCSRSREGRSDRSCGDEQTPSGAQQQRTLRNHLLFLDSRERGKNLPLGFAMTLQRQERVGDEKTQIGDAVSAIRGPHSPHRGPKASRAVGVTLTLVGCPHTNILRSAKASDGRPVFKRRRRPRKGFHSVIKVVQLNREQSAKFSTGVARARMILNIEPPKRRPA